MAVSPHSMARFLCAPSMASCETLLYAIASSLVRPSGSSIATACVANPLRIVPTSAEPIEAREPAQRISCATQVASGTLQGQGTHACRDSVIDLTGEIALVRETIQKAGALSRLQMLLVAERRSVIGNGLTVRTDHRRALRSERSELQHRIAIACAQGVVHETRLADTSTLARREHAEDLLVKRARFRGRHRVFHCAAR